MKICLDCEWFETVDCPFAGDELCDDFVDTREED